jgi:hypothetical protein
MKRRGLISCCHFSRITIIIMMFSQGKQKLKENLFSHFSLLSVAILSLSSLRSRSLSRSLKYSYNIA